MKQSSFDFLNNPKKNSGSHTTSAITNNNNTIRSEDKPFHNWYRFVLSYPPHLVRDYIKDFGLDNKTKVLDPFCGTGTTNLEAKLKQIPSIGLEANPFPHFASSVKVDWNVNPSIIESVVEEVCQSTYKIFSNQGIGRYPFSPSLH